ncbi:hypothetical protein B0H16DRAFT_1474442 [Mycena metata]|uniref:Uncharacterized protein n=1 Tax=Mycena metata TaxID=1033252 RepID=A0AAD7MJE1_9AGAR|nr:hypothetical protein B0H16DRAFT_1474442 [Mycena metata]
MGSGVVHYNPPPGAAAVPSFSISSDCRSPSWVARVKQTDAHMHLWRPFEEAAPRYSFIFFSQQSPSSLSYWNFGVNPRLFPRNLNVTLDRVPFRLPHIVLKPELGSHRNRQHHALTLLPGSIDVYFDCLYPSTAQQLACLAHYSSTKPN